MQGNHATDLLQSSNAVSLFLQQPRQILAGFELWRDDLPAVRQICQMVDGTPLAILLPGIGLVGYATLLYLNASRPEISPTLCFSQ